MKKGPYFASIILALLLIITIIFREKYIYLAPGLNVTISIIPYAFTFLIPIILVNKYKFKSAKKIINYSFFSILIFYAVVTILSSIPAAINFIETENIIREVFTPYSFTIFGLIIYYPDFTILGLALIYLLSHNILISVYEALCYYTNKHISFMFGLFISFIIDSMLLVPLLHFKEIFYKNIITIDIIKMLTAHFMIMIVLSLIISAIYSISIRKEV